MVGLSRFGAGCRLAGLVVLGNGLALSALADTFYLKNGEVIDATVVRGTLNTLALQSGNSVRLTSTAQIDRVVLKLTDGREVSGELLSWKDGIFELRSADDLLRVADGVLLDDDAPAVETATAPAPAEAEVAALPPETTEMRTLPTFTLKSGDILVGKILHATGSVLTIRPEGSSALPISRAQILTVSFENEDGEEISGALVDWQDGVYRLQVDDREVLADLPDDAADALSPPSAAVFQATVGEPPDTPVAAEIAQPDAAALPPSEDNDPVESTRRKAPEEGGAGGPANEIAVAGLTIEDEGADGDSLADGTENGQHLIETLVEAVDEGGDAVTFKFQLSKPAVRPLVVLYAATDSSAKAGEDYEAKSGVITFAAGSSYAEVQVPIIDDDRGEDSEEFNLFLSGDPETIAFSERQIAVTINDDD